MHEHDTREKRVREKRAIRKELHMAKRKRRTRSGKAESARTRMADRNPAVGGNAEANVVPRVLLGLVNGVESVGTGALELTRGVLLSAVSGAVNIGAEALTAAGAGARGVVSAASRMVGDIAGTAQDTFQEVMNRSTRRAQWRTAMSASGDASPATVAPSTSSGPSRPRRRGRRARPAIRPARTSAAA